MTSPCAVSLAKPEYITPETQHRIRISIWWWSRTRASCSSATTCRSPSSLNPSASLLLSSLKCSDTRVYEPYIRAFLGTASQFCEVAVLNLSCNTSWSSVKHHAGKECGDNGRQRKGVGGRKIYRDIERMREREGGNKAIETEREQRPGLPQPKTPKPHCCFPIPPEIHRS